MKILKSLSILGLVASAVACGSSNSGTTTNAATATCTAYTAGCLTGVVSSASETLPLISLGMQIGYKTITPVIYGYNIPNGTSTSYQTSAAVNAGDMVVVDLTNSSVQAAIGCYKSVLGGFGYTNIVSTYSEALPAPTVTLNGTALSFAQGPAIASSAGTLSITGTYPAMTGGCSGTATVEGYSVSFGSTGIYTAHCTNMAGAAITCPTN